MAIGLHAQTQIYNEEFHAGYTETLTQETDAFNARSNGAIVMRTNPHRGYYKRAAFFEPSASLITRRDLTADPATPITDLAFTEDELVSVKLFRKIGPKSMSLGAFRTMMEDPGTASILLGQEAAKASAVDMLNSALRGGVAAISGVAALVHNVTTSSPTDTVSSDNLLQMLGKAGDSANGIVLFAMHSVSYFKLVRDQISQHEFDAVAGVNIATGTPVTFGRPVLVTDALPLYGVASPTGPAYVLGLREGAITLEESEVSDMVTDNITGGGQLGVRLQGEFAYTLGIKGFRWDITTGGANPLDTAVATSGNWDVASHDNKLLAGVMLQADPT